MFPRVETLLSHYLGYTLSQHLGYSLRLATRGQRSADLAAPLRVFFWRFMRFLSESVIVSFAIFFCLNRSIGFDLKSVTSSLTHPRPNRNLGCHPNTETKVLPLR
jgi:hypothetical protein